MKQVSSELALYLNTRTEFIMCDLYVLTLQSGLTFRYANYDIDVTLPDGSVFACKGPQFKRARTKLSSEITVDKLNVEVTIDANDKIGDVPMMHIAHNGGFDEATLSLLRCFFDVPGVVIGTMEMFTGYVDVKDGGGLGMGWEVKSGVQKLNVDYPKNKYYPTCPYSLYDDDCGLDVADHTTEGVVTAVTSYQDFNTNVVKPDNYYDQGGIEWLTGKLVGVSAPVKLSTSSNGRIVMLIPLDAAPTVGDRFRIYPGCNKTPVLCSSKFDNFAHNRATPYIPTKETIV